MLKYLNIPAAIRIALLCLWAVATGVFSTVAYAQTAGETTTVILQRGQSEADINSILKAAYASGRNVVVRWEDPAPAAASPAPAKAAATPVAKPPMATPLDQAEELAGNVLDSFTTGLSVGIAGIGHIAELPFMMDKGMQTQGDDWGHVTLVTLAALLAAGIAGWIVFRLGTALIVRPISEDADLVHRARGSFARTLRDIAAICAFIAVGHIIINMPTAGSQMASHLTVSLLHAAALTLIYAAVGRLFLSPGDPSARLLPINNPQWHFRMLVAYGFIGALIGQLVRLSIESGVSRSVTEGWFLIAATVVTLLKLWWFIGGRKDISAVFAGPAPNMTRQVIATALPAFLSLTAILIWVVGCMAASSPQRAHWGEAAGATQVIVLLIPIFALGLHALIAAMHRRHHNENDLPPLMQALIAAIQTLVTGGIWLLGLYIIIRLWTTYLDDTGYGLILSIIRGLLRVSVAIVVGWAIWSFLRHYFSALSPSSRPLLPGQEETDGPAPTAVGRLSTILPLVRDLAFGAIVAITALVVLSSLGMDIGPLLAGFGVLGLAISFGSQTLVKDVVSGIFFIADDAFRTGEYIDTGKLKGTVERITLRSLQLRHQNGPVHTIPFGQIQSVTNYSRDWSTIKFELRFDRDTDPEKIRKTVKKVGQEMLEDAEFGSEFLVPLKFQGIQDITENSMVVRLKFTAKPGNPSLIQRESMKRLLVAFREAGLMLASNAVTVRSGTNDAVGAGAATQIAIEKAAEQAATQAAAKAG
ncbi:mechanosensitive ion channel domain-containing protein [Phyllobacterium sp. OV277]|uniref:mechanosensitive ion channel domain-containing protein n=1 Tax=Phyllobacterium sp. OV277 TaxID=1882772 RepID=UPI00088362D7|nr:mechanosensitive ion channel domain-containing protein [Phyllobacterium sp. OV277]SDP78838.1 Small-conductance mechanosensitive channel [Phyllobacterium sp. OV277]